MIAGHAKLLDCMMVTNNVSEFGRVHTSSQAQSTQQNNEEPFPIKPWQEQQFICI